MNRHHLQFLETIAIAALLSAGSTPAAEPLRSRTEFAKAMSSLKEGMTAEEAQKQLGKPDDVRTENDPGGISTNHTKEIWRYGTAGHLTPATLGEVYVDTDDCVQYIFGAGKPPPDGMFEERELRRLLAALDQVPSYSSGGTFNPRLLIRAVNLLQPLGKEKSLAAIEEYLRVSSKLVDDDGRKGVFLVLRTLFEVPKKPGHMPVMYVGSIGPANHKDKKLLPRYPLALEGDIPLLLVEWYALAGFPEQPETHVAYFRKNGKLREKPLTPVGDPMAQLEELAKSPRWTFNSKEDFGTDEDGRHIVAEQLLRLIDSVYRVEPKDDGTLLPWGDDQRATREKCLKAASEVKIRWDTTEQKYVFLDGTSLPEPEVRIHRREVWRPTVPGLKVEITLQREGKRTLCVRVNEEFDYLQKIPPGAVKVFSVKDKDRPLMEFRAGSSANLEDGRRITSRYDGQQCKLDEGAEVQVELIANGKSIVSPVYKPE